MGHSSLTACVLNKKPDTDIVIRIPYQVLVHELDGVFKVFFFEVTEDVSVMEAKEGAIVQDNPWYCPFEIVRNKCQGNIQSLEVIFFGFSNITRV